MDGQEVGFLEGEEMKSEEIEGSGVSIRCCRGCECSDPENVVEIGVDGWNDGSWTFRALDINDAEELFVQALKMIRARKKRLKK